MPPAHASSAVPWLGKLPSLVPWLVAHTIAHLHTFTHAHAHADIRTHTCVRTPHAYARMRLLVRTHVHACMRTGLAAPAPPARSQRATSSRAACCRRPTRPSDRPRRPGGACGVSFHKCMQAHVHTHTPPSCPSIPMGCCAPSHSRQRLRRCSLGYSFEPTHVAWALSFCAHTCSIGAVGCGLSVHLRLHTARLVVCAHWAPQNAYSTRSASWAWLVADQCLRCACLPG